jgi:drug/metabolite transporter, DME family
VKFGWTKRTGDRLDTASLPPWRPKSATAALQVLAAAVLFGTTGTAQALGPTGTTPLGVGATRLLIGGVALLAVLPLLGVRPSDAMRLWRSPIALLAGVCTALYQVCFFAAVRDAGVALGTLVTIGSGPIFAGLLARIILGERLIISWVAATALCVGGLTLLTLDGAAQIDAGVVPLLLALAAGLAYAVYTVAAKQLTTRGENSSAVMASAFALGGLLLVPVLLTQPLDWLGTPSGITMALYLGLATTTLAYVLFGKGLAVLPAGPVTTLVLAEPLVATTLGVTLLDERLAPLGLVGAALVFVGLALQGLTVSRRKPAVPTLPS